MATRKRLSDLLREEVQRPDDEPETPAETPAAKPASGSSPARSSRAKSKSTGNPSPTRAKTPAKATPAAAESTPPTEQNGHGDIAPLKAALADLQTQLEAARAQEGILQRQVDTLKTDLKERDALVQQLQADLRDRDRLRAELDEAKHMIRGLTEQHQAEEAARKVAPQPPAAPAPAPPQPQPAEPPAGALRRQVQVHATSELWRVLQHPVAVEIPSTQLSNEDIGWVD